MTEEAEPSAGWLERVRALFRRHKRRIGRLLVMLTLGLIAVEVSSSWPNDATLSLPVAELRRLAGDADELDVVIVLAGEGEDGEAFSHARLHLEPGVRAVTHAVHLAPGRYSVHAVLGEVRRVGHFEIPADGVVRVEWREP